MQGPQKGDGLRDIGGRPSHDRSHLVGLAFRTEGHGVLQDPLRDFPLRPGPAVLGVDRLFVAQLREQGFPRVPATDADRIERLQYGDGA